MAKEKIKDKDVEEIKELLKENKILIGTERVMKYLKNNKISKVIISSNCNKEIIDDFSHYSKLSGIDIKILNYPNDEIGVICKKPFAISVLGVLR